MPRRFVPFLLVAAFSLAALCLAAAGLYNIPAINDKLYPRVDTFLSQLRNLVAPAPVAVPTALAPATGGPAGGPPTFAPETPTAPAPSATAASQPAASAPPAASPTATVPPATPVATLVVDLPDILSLKGTRYEPQLFNNCGPATLTADLVYWGWHGSQPDSLAWYGNGQDIRWQKDIAAVIKPGKADKNVMPYELANYAEDNAGLASMLRFGGSIDLLRKLVANGFPVIIERGFPEAEHGQVGQGWEGHYGLVTGYDNGKRMLLLQDSFKGANYWIDYDSFTADWRDFNYLYLMLYPPDRGGEVAALLGPEADVTTNLNNALVKAQAEAAASSDPADLAFDWFDVGTSLQLLGRNADAAQAFDQARSYGTLPYRMLWYQTYMYKAYFYTKRYQDVLDLANGVLQTPSLEESFYWRGWAYHETGNLDAAVADMRSALDVHPGWDQASAALKEWGVSP